MRPHHFRYGEISSISLADSDANRNFNLYSKAYMTARYTAALAALFTLGTGSAQNTVGLLTNNAAQSQDGYTLFYPADQRVVYLVDNCGRLVHTWSDTIYTPGNAVYLMENGDLIRCGKSDGEVNPVMQRGGAGEMVDRRTWDGELLWRYTYNTPLVRMHHDVEPMPNGNVLIIAWEYKTLEEAAALGMDTAAVDVDSVWPDHIIEVAPTGVEEGEIVWEWHAWDHLVQDRDPELPNYGVVAEHPEKININFYPVQDADWHHLNSVDYNAELDQILLSSPFFHEVWVIDHSTTTEEAATGSGGNSGKGGDLLYRWGNPRAYDRGDLEDRTLFFQHDARWLGPGLAPEDEDRGKIMVFNNRALGTASTVDIFTPPVDGSGNYTLDGDLAYGPETYDWRYSAPVPTDMFSSGLSNADKMPNGNIQICSGRQGWIFEVDAEGNMVWEYLIPLLQGEPVAQGSVIDGSPTFRGTKYPSDHPFLSTLGSTPNAYIELEPDTVFCGSISVSVEETAVPDALRMYPNPTRDLLFIEGVSGEAVQIFDLTGKVVLQRAGHEVSGRVGVSTLAAGSYVVLVGATRSALLLVEH